MKKKSKFTAILMVAVMAITLMMPFTVSAQTVEEPFGVEAFEGSRIWEDGREVFSLRYALENGRATIVDGTSRSRMVSTLPANVTLRFGDTIVELELAGAALTWIDSAVFDAAVANGNVTALTEEMIANGHVTFADANAVAENIESRIPLTCQILGCQLVFIGAVQRPNGAIILLFECLVCGRWFY